MFTATLIAQSGWRAGGLLFGVLVPLVILALVAYGIWELWRSHEPTPAAAGAYAAGAAGAGSPSAMAVLDERFARGEIDADEYVQRRTLLTQPVWTAPTAPPTTAPPTTTAGDAPDAAATVEQPAADPSAD